MQWKVRNLLNHSVLHKGTMQSEWSMPPSQWNILPQSSYSRNSSHTCHVSELPKNEVQIFTHKSHYQPDAPCLYTLHNASTSFCHIFWPSSGSYKFDLCVQHIWQLVIHGWQTIYIKNNMNTMMTVTVLIVSIQIGRYNVEECF
jgi:hypothetical protein